MSRSLLLDTCASIWLLEGTRLSFQATQKLNDHTRQKLPVFVSAMTAWEVGQLVASGRLPSVLDAHNWFKRLTGEHSVVVVDLTADILIASSFLPKPIHGDPADRIIIATARKHALTILTRDRRILDYAGAGHVLALAC